MADEDRVVIELDCAPMAPRYFDGRFSSGALWNGDLEPQTVGLIEGGYVVRRRPGEDIAKQLSAVFGGRWTVRPVQADLSAKARSAKADA